MKQLVLNVLTAEDGKSVPVYVFFIIAVVFSVGIGVYVWTNEKKLNKSKSK